MTPGAAALIGLMERYLAGLLDPHISLLEVHKLMYFMQETGEPLRLRIAKGVCGPYAENLRHVLSGIEGCYVTGYGAGGDGPDKNLELIPRAIEDARELLDVNVETRTRFTRVADLVKGFESPFGLELLATVHWVMTRDGAQADEELIDRTYPWSDRKRQFSPEQLCLAKNVLTERGWVPAN
ncbi:MAG: hypothetical protein L0271_15400 [Gemmatimonadetes bacterium]|nr:hypothetical protein [Gemmatimonadota bacterium]